MPLRFDVAFSLAGEQRESVEPVAEELRKRGHSVFFYGWPQYQAELAAPHLDKLLRRIYGQESRLVVPLISADYERKPWTGEVEFTVVRELLFDGQTSVMPMRADDTPIEGFSKLHGYFDIRGQSSLDIVDRIERRLNTPAASSSTDTTATGLEPSSSTTSISIPPLPRWVIERTAEVTRLTEALRAAALDPHALAVAVVGMPGIGKTTLLKMACRVETRPSDYSDVVWITVGREANLVGLIREAAITLGGNPQDYSRDDVVLIKFKELLQRRRVLVALDDVWRKNDVEPFLVSGSKSRVLFSTRDRTLPIALGATEIRVGTMDIDQAVRLIRSWSGRQSDTDAAIVERLGGHPLALRLAGIQLQDRARSADEWLRAFNQLSQLRLGRATQDRDEDLDICFDLSLRALSADEAQLYFSLGIFSFQSVVPQPTILRFWSQLGRSHEQASQALRDFERAGLLEIGSHGISLHDLLRQYAREHLGASARTLHLRLLQAYGAKNDQSVPEQADSYYKAFSAYHFREGRVRQSVAAKFAEHDVLGWALSFFSWWMRRHSMPAPAKTPSPFPDHARVAVMGNWGTGLYGAPVVAQSIVSSGPYDLVLHVGNVYYSGLESEIRNRFLRFWPTEAARMSRALNGNHLMYSGGDGYFDHVLPAFGQTSSCFSMANAHWLLVFLDTAHGAHPYADLSREQCEWLHDTMAQAEGRRIALFSHHYLFTPFDRPLPKLRAAIAAAVHLPVAVWYWAHEHHCIVFDSSPSLGGMRGRCIGNGGFPQSRLRKIRQLPTERVCGSVAWKRFPASSEHPAGLVLDGPNPYMVGRESNYGPHGYATLEFDGPHLTERIHLADGTTVWENQLADG